MKIPISFLISTLLIVVPGCGNPFRKRVPADKVGQNSPGMGTLEEEDVEEFDLGSDENPFVRTDERGLTFVEDDAEANRARDESMARYGLKPIYFDFNRDDIRGDQMAALSADLKVVQELTKKGQTVVVEGHACDSAGSAAYNMHLSHKRANKVANYLSKKGVKKKNLKVVGRGHEMPLVRGGDREAQAPNRRVEIYVLD